MDKQRWQQIRQIFSQISEQSQGFRQQFLEMACEDDPELREQVEGMLQAHDVLNADQPEKPPADHLPEMLGDIRILSEVGSGGMSKVFRGHHDQYGGVAVKCLHSNLFRSASAKLRFRREAELLGSIKHPVLCKLHEVIEVDDAMALVLEYVAGETLETILLDGALEIRQALRIARDVCDLLVVTHARDIIHRDIKPGNIIIMPNDETRLLDFGIASQPDAKLTTTGQILGSPAYMSPEQWLGEKVDERTDLWAIGVLLQHMCTGQLPFEGENLPEAAASVIHHSPRKWQSGHDTPEVTIQAQQLCSLLMQKAASNRPESVSAVLSTISNMQRCC